FMRALVVALLALAATVTSAPAQTLRDLLDKFKVVWNTPTEPFRIVGNIHYVGTEGLASYLVTSPQGHILIDTGLPEANPQITAIIKKLGSKHSATKSRLNPQPHPPPPGGLPNPKRAPGPPLRPGAAEKPLPEGGSYPGQENETPLAFPPVKVDRTIGEG